MSDPLLVVVSGPSGVGKDTVLGCIRKMQPPNLHFTITTTTRAMRSGECEGSPYHFTTLGQFRGLVESDELLEHAIVHGNHYGVPKQQVRDALAEGKDVLMKIDVQGAATIRSSIPGALLIFIAPPDLDALERRLTERQTESPADLERRLQDANHEMAQRSLYDFVITNDEGRACEAATEVLRAIEEFRVSHPRASVRI
jgi:guanylate kinase